MFRTMRLKACCVCTLSLSTTSLDFNTWFAPLMQDSSAESRKDPQNSINSLYQHNLGPEKKKRLLSFIIAHFWALKVIAKFGVSHCSKFSVCVCHCIASCPCFAPCNCYCRHDPFIVRSAPPLAGVHSAYTSVSMFTINVDNCLFLCF